MSSFGICILFYILNINSSQVKSLQRLFFIVLCGLSLYSGHCFQLCSSVIRSHHLPNQLLLCSETLEFFSVVAPGVNLTPVFVHIACIAFILYLETKHMAKGLKERGAYSDLQFQVSWWVHEVADYTAFISSFNSFLFSSGPHEHGMMPSHSE